MGAANARETFTSTSGTRQPVITSYSIHYTKLYDAWLGEGEAARKVRYATRDGIQPRRH